MKRVLCVYLPHWPLQRLRHEQAALRDKQVAVVGQRGRAQKVTDCCAHACRAGVRPGMTLAEAMAVAPMLSAHVEDPESDLRALTRLAEWCGCFGPTVGLEEMAAPSSLLIDVTGCTGNHGGEEQFLAHVADEFSANGWQVRVALAETVGAAWALAHGSASAQVVAPPGKIEELLLPLSVATLRLPVEALQHLAVLGVERISQLLVLPRASLSDRFGSGVLQRVDQAFGRLAEPIVRYRAVPEVLASCSFEYPVDQREIVYRALDGLLQRLEEQLQQRCQGARRLECRLYVEDGPPVCIEIELHRPGRCAQRLGKLLQTKLERVELAAPLSGLCVRVPLEEPLTEQQLEMFDGNACERDREFSALIDGLSSRLGRDAVTVVRLVADAQPELACRFEPATRDRTANAPPALDEKTLQHRPLQVWPTPLPIQVLAVAPEGLPHVIRSAEGEYTVRQSWGPERIETGWWRGQDIHRDYYVVETHLGARLWIFRQHDDDRWFWHGCFD